MAAATLEKGVATPTLRYAGVLPFSRFEGGTVRVLLGREIEAPGWPPSGTWSCWGGAPNKGETAINAAARECFEECMGMLGTASSIAAMVHPSHDPAPIKVETDSACVFLCQVSYDPQIVQRFAGVYDYLHRCSKEREDRKGVLHVPSCPDGYMEKTAMRWFTLDEIKEAMRTSDPIFRPSFLRTFASIAPKLLLLRS